MLKTYLKIIVSKSKGYSIMPVVGALARNTSCIVGTKLGAHMRFKSLR